MSGRPPPPLPPSASAATRTRSTAEMRAGEVVGDAGRHRRLVAGVGDEQDHAGAEPRLVLVDQPAQVLAGDAGERLREERDAGDGLRPLRLGRAAGQRQPAAQLARSRPPAPCARRGARGRGRRAPRAGRAAGPAASASAASAAARCASAPAPVSASIRRTPLAEAPSETSLKVPMSPVRADMGAAAELERIGVAAGAEAAARRARPWRPRAPRRRTSRRRAPGRRASRAASGVMIRVSTGVFCRT